VDARNSCGVDGTPHIDHWTVAWSEYGSNPLGTPRGSAADESRAASQAGDYGERADATSFACGDQFPLRYAVDAAIAALRVWVRAGRPAPSAPPMNTVTGPNGRIQLARDASAAVRSAKEHARRHDCPAERPGQGTQL
jgi:hypothetical protein